jgi:uncharacterized protein
MALPRLYDRILREHLGAHRQMAFVAGPRQVGKTTTCRGLAESYLSWDNRDHRQLIQRGPGAVADDLGLARLRSSKQVVAPRVVPARTLLSQLL